MKKLQTEKMSERLWLFIASSYCPWYLSIENWLGSFSSKKKKRLMIKHIEYNLCKHSNVFSITFERSVEKRKGFKRLKLLLILLNKITF